MKIRAGNRNIEVRPTIADRVVSWFDPRAGLDRLRARVMMDGAVGGYVGGGRDRRQTRNWRPQADTSANQDTRFDLRTLRARTRDLARNMPIATGAIATVTTNVVGDGLSLLPSIDRETLGIEDDAATAWESAAVKEFELFRKTADFTRVQSFEELQALVFRSSMESGDVLCIRRYRKDAGDTYGTKIQVVEADRLSNPNWGVDSVAMMAGVALSTDGVPIGYSVSNRYLMEIVQGSPALQWTTVPAFDEYGSPLALHLFDRLRPDQARGVPYLAPVIEALKTIGDYAEAEVRAAVVAAMFTVFVTSERGEDEAPIVGSVEQNNKSDEITLGNGAIVDLAPGETINAANPGRPNQQFDAFTTSFLRQVGVALELPFEILIKHFTASYSASRAALETAWQFFRRRRMWLARRFCQPVYEWVITEAIASGRLSAPGFFNDPLVRAAYLGADWIGSARISLDPMKDAQADAMDLAGAVKTRSQIITERTGGDWRRKLPQLVKEENDLEAAGINKAPPISPREAAKENEGNADETAAGDQPENEKAPPS